MAWGGLFGNFKRLLPLHDVKKNGLQSGQGVRFRVFFEKHRSPRRSLQFGRPRNGVHRQKTQVKNLPLPDYQVSID